MDVETKLRRLRDQVRLDLHLASMNAKDAWRAVEPRVEEAEKLAADVTEISRNAVQDITRRVRQFAEQVTRPPPQA